MAEEQRKTGEVEGAGNDDNAQQDDAAMAAAAAEEDGDGQGVPTSPGIAAIAREEEEDDGDGQGIPTSPGIAPATIEPQKAKEKEDDGDGQGVPTSPGVASAPDGGAARMMEQAVEATEASTSAARTKAEKPVLTSVDDASDLHTKDDGGGFTGEIVGRVVTLAELENVKDEGTDEATYDQLRKLIEETLTDVSEHEIVHGRIVSVGEKDVVIDIGFKSDGIVSRSEFDRELAPGDEVEVYLERIEDYHGQLVLSKSKADKVQRWQRVEEAYEREEVLEGTIVRRIKGGMIVQLFDELEAFLPGSQIDVRPVRDFDAYLDRRMEFKIVKLNPANENIVVSHKALIEKELQAQREKILATMEPGQVLEGTVKNITDFGVFIDLGGVDGLLHITDLSWGRVSHPSELVGLDEKLNVVVLDYDKERQRISLGLKQLQPHPWESIHEQFAEGQVVEGKVVSITDYGAFVELQKGIEGLVHISEMSWTEHIRHPSQMVALGQIVKVKILNIDHDGKKISLGMKQLKPDPWQGIAQRYPAGTVLRGKVRNITNFGVFVEIEPGIDGLVHISDLSWTKRIRHPSEMIRKGQELDIVILNVDESERRISLGHKQVQTNPWTQFQNVYSEGSDTKATVLRVEEKGIVVELPLEVEGFVPASELRQGGRDFHSLYREGEELQLQVIRFDPSDKEIVLSEVAKERAEERERREAEAREKRTERDRERREIREFSEATSGPTTLAELSGLEDLRAQMAAQEQADAAATASVEETAPAEAVASTPEPDADEATAAAPKARSSSKAKAQAAAESEASADAVSDVEATPATPSKKGGKRAEKAASAEESAEPTASKSRSKASKAAKEAAAAVEPEGDEVEETSAKE
ncbi:MAG TPA: 30S ribosomal protein S1 [Rhodothermales bacterium]